MDTRTHLLTSIVCAQSAANAMQFRCRLGAKGFLAGHASPPAFDNRIRLTYLCGETFGRFHQIQALTTKGESEQIMISQSLYFIENQLYQESPDYEAMAARAKAIHDDLRKLRDQL